MNNRVLMMQNRISSFQRSDLTPRQCRGVLSNGLGALVPLQHTRIRRSPVSASMHVPSDSFGGLSPERKASDVLRTLFTFVAARVVLAQLEGSGRGQLGSYNAESYQDLAHFLQERPMKSGDAWLGELMAHNSMLALRIMEVRSAYSEEDFEWHNLQRVANRDMQDANQKLLQKYATEAFTKSWQATPEEGAGSATSP